MNKFEVLSIKHRIYISFYCAISAFCCCFSLGLTLDLAFSFLTGIVLGAAIVVSSVTFSTLDAFMCSLPTMYFKQYQKRRFTVGEITTFYAIPTAAGMIVGISAAVFCVLQII